MKCFDGHPIKFWESCRIIKTFFFDKITTINLKCETNEFSSYLSNPVKKSYVSNISLTIMYNKTNHKMCLPIMSGKHKSSNAFIKIILFQLAHKFITFLFHFYP